MQHNIQTPILMYHAITRDVPPSFRRFAVSPDDFASQMQFLADIGFEAISTSDYVRRSREGLLHDRMVVLTFDDGFADFETSVMPCLVRLNFSATLYVVSGLVGRTATWLPAGCRLALLDWHQLADVAAQGVEIGAHSMSHPQLDGLPLLDARHEIRMSRLLIETHLGRKVRSFAYPFGFRDDRIITLVAEAGFESACAVRYKTCTPSENVYDLPRHIVRGDMSLGEFEQLVRGSPPRIRQAFDCLRSDLGSIWRRTTRRVAI